MGLDANFYSVRRDPPIEAQVDFNDQLRNEDGEPLSGVEVEEIHYFRKHHDLQGWMQRLYEKKGGEAGYGAFNCVPVMLTAEDLDQLAKDASGDQLPETSGFFFGGGNTEHYKAETLKTVEECRTALAAGAQVFYSSWW